MLRTSILQALVLEVLFIFGAAANAQNVPGEDPVQIKSQVTYQMAPNPIIKKSTDINMKTGLSGADQAKLTRYTAMAYSAKPNVLTDKDVVSSVSTKGLYTTCVQSVGSTTAPASGAASVLATQQVVVLRGDLVNVCN